MLEPDSELPFFVFRDRMKRLHLAVCPDWFVTLADTSGYAPRYKAVFHQDPVAQLGVSVTIVYRRDALTVNLHGHEVVYSAKNIWQLAGARLKGFYDWLQLVVATQVDLNTKLSELIGHPDSPLAFKVKELKADWAAQLDESIAYAQEIGTEISTDWVGIFDA